MSRCQGSSSTRIFLVPENFVFSKKTLTGQTGCERRMDREGWESTGDEGNSGNCTWDTGWNTGVKSPVLLHHWSKSSSESTHIKCQLARRGRSECV